MFRVIVPLKFGMSRKRGVDICQQTWCRTVSRGLTSFKTLQDNKSKLFKTIPNTVDPQGNEFKNNVKHSHILENKYNEAMAIALSGGGAKAIERHVKKNRKMLATDRLRQLLDNPESFLELSTLCGLGMPYGDVPRAGIISGIGKIQGIYCMLIVNDASVKGGTMYPIAVKKQLRAQEIALQNRLPCVYVVDSGGAFLPLQAAIFPDKEHGGRVFYNEAILTSEDVPQLSIVCGNCTAGGAYVPTMTPESVIVHRVGSIFLGGPPLVYAALGEVVSAEDLGGATMHCSVSGCTDHFAATEDEAFSLGRDIVATFNVHPSGEPSDVQEPLYSPDELPGLIPTHNQHTMDSYQVIARIVDGSKFQEFKAMFGKGLITGFAFLHGHMVGLVASNGTITSEAALKACHFVQVCSQRNIPLVFLQNTTPENTEDVEAAGGAAEGSRLRAHASLMSAIACAQVHKLTVIIGNSFGSSNYLMCGRSFSPEFLFSWPNAEIAITEPHSLVETVSKTHFPGGIEAESEAYKTFQEKVAEPLSRSTSAFYSSSHIWDDGIILPQHTRKVLGECLNILSQSERTRDQPRTVMRM